jgi:hypothetical protein
LLGHPLSPFPAFLRSILSVQERERERERERTLLGAMCKPGEFLFPPHFYKKNTFYKENTLYKENTCYRLAGDILHGPTFASLSEAKYCHYYRQSILLL